MKLVDNWKNCWKWFSVHCIALLVTIPAAWEAIPPYVRDRLPPDLLNYLICVVALAAFVGRLIDQTGGKSNAGNPGDGPQ